MKQMPEGYEAQVGDIITYDNRRAGMRGKCVIDRIIAPGFYLEKEGTGGGFILEFELPVKIVRPKGKKFITVWEPSIIG